MTAAENTLTLGQHVTNTNEEATYEVVDFRSDRREVRIASVRTNRTKWVSAEALTPAA